MKRYIYIIVSALALTSCGNWLDAPRPMGQTEERDIFNSEQGFRTVLTGVYIDVASDRLYGHNMSMVYPEMFAQHWDATRDSAPWAARELYFEHAGLKGAIEASWSEYYNEVVNINSLLDNIDAKRHLFTQNNFDMIKGEALGMRGFLHFDILRLWGPVPKGADMQKKSIPYVTEVTRKIDPLLSKPYGKVLELIIKDLDEAEELLTNDAIGRFDSDILNTPNQTNTAAMGGDDYLYYRHTRMNLYAVKAVKARYYMWIGDYVNAAKYAREVIEGQVGADADNKIFKLCDRIYLGEHPTERNFEPEHIFSLFRNDMAGLVRGIFRAGGELQQTVPSVIEAMYDNNGNDIRQRGFWETEAAPSGINYYVYTKFITPELAVKEEAAHYVPVIKLPEMYLIATECAARGGFNKTEVDKWFEPYYLARNIDPGIMTGMTDEASTMVALEREWRKEFFGEGQMFYYFKRLGTTAYTFPINMTMDPLKYVVPQPDKQIEFEL